MIHWLRNISYEKRLKELNLFRLSKSRLWRDLIDILGFDNININDYVTTDLTSITHNNGLKIIGKRFNPTKRCTFSLIESWILTMYISLHM